MIGTNICKLRKKRKLTLSELAEKAKVSKSYLSNIERDINKNPSVQVLKKIALVLDVDLSTLLTINTNAEMKHAPEREWIEFIFELKKAGVEKEKIHEYQILIDFIKWSNSRDG
ncbi:transcriptional regulator [Bacillus manliponensis]|uniref:Transcriptional regulator n=1 Tax=Bacillus manliponensis TaxID=574376 RepID=A0A073JYZ6_9BACI|nr:helix-turn-helix domain-containing protein [Bacillus manliponensis]KEK20294.1 transcriptional regulator [Bacillus manliponensis]